MNPAVTLTFLTLGKVNLWDAVFYVLFRFAGSALGLMFASRVIGLPLRHSAVHYVATVPGSGRHVGRICRGVRNLDADDVDGSLDLEFAQA